MLNSVKKRSKLELIFGALLIMCLSSLAFGQQDTLYTNDESLENKIQAKARDSIYNDMRNNQLHLYGEAELISEDISFKADYILVDFNKKEVLASYTYDKDSNRVGLPLFSDGTEEVEAAKIRYNFDTKKGYIQEMKVKQDENFLYMETAKRQTNEELHFRKGRFTHCDLIEPHYHLQLSKAILIPEKRIVSGPMNLWVKGVPTPLGLPFLFIPQKKEREQNHGILFPQFALQSPYGMGFQNLGYYIPINDSLQTTFFANLYSRGSWGLSNQSDYKIRYKFDGSLYTSFQQFKLGFPDSTRFNKISVRWSHRQNQKANPFWNFNASVNFNSDNATKTSLDVQNADYFKSTMTSDVNLQRSFPGKPYSGGIKISLRQNSLSKNIDLVSPHATFNVSRFSPFAKLKKEGVVRKRWYEQIAMTYNVEGQNKNSFGDTVLKQKRYDLITQNMLNGFSQNSTLQSTIGLFQNTWKLNPSVTYQNKINFQQTRKFYDPSINGTRTDTIQQAGMAHQVAFAAQLTTALYSYYRFIGKNKTLLRHILTPSFSYRYTPNLGKVIEDSVGVDKQLVRYSPFERSLYAQSAVTNTSVLSFGFNNTFELKTKSSKDTVTGYRKTRLIDGLSFSGTYDFLKDSMNLSNISSSLRISPFPFLNIVTNASFSPYDWNDSTQQAINAFAINSRNKLARLLNVNISTSLVLTSKAGRKKIAENGAKLNNNWNSDFEYFALHPEHYVDFEIPWKLTFSHLFQINRNMGVSQQAKRFNQINTLQFVSDLSLTKRWKLILTLYTDLDQQRVINSRLNLTRNMHCWNLAMDWTPVGQNKSFLLRINATSQLFKDAKIELKKPPVLF